MKVEVKMQKQAPPPVESVTVTFTAEEARLLWSFVRAVGGGFGHAPYISESITSSKMTEIREKVLRELSDRLTPPFADPDDE